MRFGLTDREYEILNQLAVAPRKGIGSQVWIFGSRARGNHKTFSDFDLLYQLPESNELPPGFLFQIRETLEESDLPYKVDLVSINDLAKSFEGQILIDRIEI